MFKWLCFHSWTKVQVMAGCRERMDCGKCGKEGEVQVKHSWGLWVQSAESWGQYNGKGVKLSTYGKIVQKRTCVKCNFLQREEIV